MQEKKIIQALGFKPKENTLGIFYKKYNNYTIEIDFEKKQFDFGNKITAGRETTQKFSRPENWVILECVDRLLEKGYKPENIILEKKYTVGHGPSGGWLDVLVTREDGSAYLMIECKTWGTAFEKEFKKTEKDGGQLMTYFQQDKSADILMLYASKLDKNKVQFRNEIIKIEDHYRQAGNVEDVFDRWNKVTNTNGIFDDWVEPYLFESKTLLKRDLIDLNEEVSKSLFNKFLSILRKHSVSDKPNAFNVIFDLFLSKLWDEKKEPHEELDFQWREKEDDAVSFQYRLLDLYRAGMDDFLKKEVFGLNDSDFSANTPKELKKIKKKVLMLEKVFNIKSVIDVESFEENNRVLKEIVQLLQSYKIRYPRKQQHLSDFFERLLTTGLKQEAGQFFTPPPITRFIIKSLPIKQLLTESINQKSPKLPAVIDYAAGSGHFLTEIMEEYQSIINKIDITNFKTDAKKHVQKWRIDEYDWAAKYIYGIDKDYRLVKVAKVGCYFYGDGLAQVIHGNGLDNFENSKSFRGLLKDNVKKPQFQLVLSNPPYSVSAFKTNLNSAYASKDFNLFNSLTDRSSEIECLFIERTKQLLKTDGIAAIILPSSILSNAGIYAQAREVILKAFDIIAITELGSATFMATGTNTVTLFLKRREDTVAENVKESVAISFTNTKDNSINDIEKPIEKYLSHVWETISFEDYKTFLQKNPNEAIKQHEIFKEYDKKIPVLPAGRKAKKEVDKWTKILEVEKEKLLYFILTYNQKVVLVKTGQKAKEKQFLGYEFSNRRGNEGMHPIQRSKTIDECTQLYDGHSFTNENKASTYIHKAFTEHKFDLEIPETLKENVSYQNLIDMFTFDRADFEQNISLSVKKKMKIESRWESKRFDEVAEIIRGVTYSKSDQSYSVTDKIILTADNITLSGKFEINKQIFLNTNFNISKEKKLKKNDIFICFSSGSKKHLGKVAFISNNTKYFAGGFMGIIRVKNNNESKYFFQLLNTILRQSIRDIGSGSNINNLSGIINSIKIPLPPIDIQQKIVSEIEALEQQEEKAVEKIEELKSNIYKTLNSFPQNTVSTFCAISIEKENPQNNKGINYNYLGLEHIESNTGKITINKELGENILSTKNKFKKGDILYGKLRPYLNKVAEPNFDGICSTDILVLNTYVPKLLKYALRSDEFVNQTSDLMSGVSLPRIKVKDFLNLKISLPTKDKQEQVVFEIEKLEKKITELEKQIAEIPKQKEAILKRYLE